MDGERSEEKAEEYLEDLVKRNLVIVTSKKSNGKIKSCSLHDMVRDLCIRKAHEENFLHVMDGFPCGLVNERRISFSRSDLGNKIWYSTFRTILCFQTQNTPSWQALLGSYKLLRVLDALGVELKEYPSQVFELYHLKYLALMGSFSIPSAISNLVNLQTLIIHSGIGKLRGRYVDVVFHSLPSEIWMMPQLRHIFFNAPYMLPCPSNGIYVMNHPLENLQTLYLVKDLVWSKKFIQMLPNIMKLGLLYTIDGVHQYNLHHLKDLSHLEKLEVIGIRSKSHSLVERNLCISFPYTLKKLTLVGGGFSWKDMAVIGSLPNLEVLKLLGNACSGGTWETADEDFPQLKLLLIDDSNLQQWITQSNPLPSLKRLILRCCWYLREIPEGVGEISTLELIEVDYCTNSLVESAKKINEDQESYGNYDLQVRVGNEEIRLCYEPATTCNDGVIGLDYDRRAIKEQLCGQSSKLQVVSIVGQSGIGKTTLARAVYFDPLILEHFEIHIWITLPREDGNLVSRKFLLSLLDSLELLDEQQSKENIDEFEMLAKVHQTLIGKRYLVVVDDVRGKMVWEHLRIMLPDDGNGNRIMFTTTLEEVGFYANSSNPLHHMRYMDDYQCWDLLKQKVFGNRNCPPDLEDIGKVIAGRCAGLPLVVVLIAGVLSVIDKTRASWNEKAIYLTRYSSDKKAVDMIRYHWNEYAHFFPFLEDIISLSCSQLPHHLRRCFFHLGEFSEDNDIHASSLVRMWVAEGFVKHESGCSKSLEEKAEEYLEDLVKRYLVIVTSRESNGKIKNCSLHDIVRHFCIKKIILCNTDGPYLSTKQFSCDMSGLHL